MPLYDCGSPECEECERAFGPDRKKAIAGYMERLRLAALPDEEFCAAIAARRASQQQDAA